MSKKLKSGIAAPITLKPFNKENDSTVHVVIETPKGCQNKYKQSRQKFKVLGVKGPKEAERLLNSTIKRAKSA